ncbi:MAG TPA: matrixin family metalloprotease [Candidatus Nanoarchaeia archaeon]|nr:matrixin family metalloprotease [Candidatus Nanoarchaeia archaeon]
MKTNFLMIMVLLSIGLVVAQPAFQAAIVTNPITGENKNSVSLPPKAVEVAPNLYYLGEAVDEGRLVEGYAIVHPASRQAKPGSQCGNGVCEAGESANKCPADCGGSPTSSCYGFLANGAKWKTLEPYMVDPTNTEGLNDSFVRSNLAADIAKWEAAAGSNIIGDETNGVVDGADTLSTDGKNEVLFGSVDGNGIAVTIVWGIFRGPPSGRELVEWDQIYDQVDFDWGNSGAATKMDFENIATHELGHSFGLDDLYTTECFEETMYGYGTEGETKKRTLEAGDIAGIQALY